MKIESIKNQFLKGELNKVEFIDAMFQFHTLLGEYSKELKNTEIEKIEIIDGKVIMTTRGTEYHKGGVKLIVDMVDKRTPPLETFNFKSFEKNDSHMIYRLINPESHVIDIGANIGWYSLHIGSMLKGGSVHSFEPLPETHAKLQENIRLNNLSNITVNHIALSEKKQTLTFFFDPYQSGSSSSRDITESPTVVKVDLESITFDEYAESKALTAIDFIKCDVEGAELFVIQGAQKSLEKYKPIVFAELLRKWSAKFGYHPNDIFKIFHDLNYTAFYTENTKLVKIDLIDDNTIPTNFFFLHNEKHATKIKELC
jgi:FkbM family methyltransferase